MNCYIGTESAVDLDFKPVPGMAVFNRTEDLDRPGDTFLFMDVDPGTFCMPHFRVLMDEENWFHNPSTLLSGRFLRAWFSGVADKQRSHLGEGAHDLQKIEVIGRNRA